MEDRTTARLWLIYTRSVNADRRGARARQALDPSLTVWIVTEPDLRDDPVIPHFHSANSSLRPFPPIHRTEKHEKRQRSCLHDQVLTPASYPQDVAHLRSSYGAVMHMVEWPHIDPLHFCASLAVQFPFDPSEHILEHYAASMIRECYGLRCQLGDH